MAIHCEEGRGAQSIGRALQHQHQLQHGGFACSLQYKVGTRVVYFPIDSRIPADIAERTNAKSFLVGPEKDRIKTAKLRGEFSQGLVSHAETVLGADWGKRKDLPYDLAPVSEQASCVASRRGPCCFIPVRVVVVVGTEGHQMGAA